MAEHENVLGGILQVLNTYEMQEVENILVAMFADDTTILTTGNKMKESTSKLQEVYNVINKMATKWKQIQTHGLLKTDKSLNT